MAKELKRYRVTSPSGFNTVVQLDAAGAKRRGLSDADVVKADAPEAAGLTPATPEELAQERQRELADAEAAAKAEADAKAAADAESKQGTAANKSRTAANK